MGVEDFRVRILAPQEMAELVRCASAVARTSWREVSRTESHVRAEIDDGTHILEVEIEKGGAVIRFSICHEETVDRVFVPFVISVAGCVRGQIRIEEELPIGASGEYRGLFEGFESDYVRAVGAKRRCWDLNFGGRRNGLRCGESLQVFVL